MHFPIAISEINDFKEVLINVVNRLNEYNIVDCLHEGEMKITIESANGMPVITQFSQEKLSITGQTMLKKMKNVLGNFGESISYEEKITILTEIIKEIIG